MNDFGNALVGIVTGLIGLAIVAVIVGTNAQTSNVITSAGTALSGVIGAAVQPVSGSSMFGYGGGMPSIGGVTL